MANATDPQQALTEAVAALTRGQFDRKSLQGAQANALESIAWSLAGILAHYNGVQAGEAPAQPLPAVTTPRPKRREPVVKLREK